MIISNKQDRKAYNMKTIEEYLIDALRSTRLYEMAKDQSECESVVQHQIKNIQVNLTLINYFRISELYTTNIGHWKDELMTSIENAHDFQMRKDRSEERRERIVNRVFNKEDVYDHEVVLERVVMKFYKEKETQYPHNKQSVEWLDEAVMRTVSQMGAVARIIILKNYAHTLNDFISNL